MLNDTKSSSFSFSRVHSHPPPPLPSIKSSYNTLISTQRAKKLSSKYNLAAITFNIRSLSKNYDEFRLLIKELKYPEILCLTELWQPTETSLYLPNYNKASISTRDNQQGGGVGIWIKENTKIKNQIISVNKPFQTFEYTTTCIEHKGNSYHIICAYRPPEDSKISDICR